MTYADSTDLTEDALLVWRAPEGVRLAAAASLPTPRNEAERFLRRLLDRAGWHRADVGENCPACGQVAPCDNQKLAGDLAAALIVDACVLAMAGQ